MKVTSSQIVQAFALMGLFLILVWCIKGIVAPNDTDRPLETIVIAPEIAENGNMLRDVLDQLAWCESGNDPSAVNYNEPNGLTSHGMFQFQYPIVEDWYRVQYDTYLPEWQFRSIAHDPYTARMIAGEIIKQDFQGGVNNWYNCAIKLNLVP